VYVFCDFDQIFLFQDTIIGEDEAIENVRVNTIKEVFLNAQPSDVFKSCNTTHYMTNFMADSLGLVVPVTTKIVERSVDQCWDFTKSFKLCLHMLCLF